MKIYFLHVYTTQNVNRDHNYQLSQYTVQYVKNRFQEIYRCFTDQWIDISMCRLTF